MGHRMAFATANKKSSKKQAAVCDDKKIRLYMDMAFKQNMACPLNAEQTHYLRRVMRCAKGEHILVFNGRDGEWQAEIETLSKKQARLYLHHQTRPQTNLPDLWLIFALIKNARLDFIAQKATEMGVAKMLPIITKRTQGGRHRRVNLARLHANAIEAAEQCGLLQVPEIAPPQKLVTLLTQWESIAPARQIVFCDESAHKGAGLDDMAKLRGQPAALLIGPEGGFDEAEREQLLARHDVCHISLGPRILRTDTAAIAGLAACQMLFGDWQEREAIKENEHG